VNGPCASLHKHIPAGYRIYQSAGDIAVFLGEVSGDLNGDGLDDCVLIIRATDKSKISNDGPYQADENPLGIMVFFNSKSGYQLALENRVCIPPPEYDSQMLHDYVVEIKKGNLYISDRGRYSGAKYTFRYKNSDFELIGFDSYLEQSASHITEKSVSINLATKKRQTKVLANENAESMEKAVYKETWDNIKAGDIPKLSKIASFGKLKFD
jgi:hypothetical protein